MLTDPVFLFFIVVYLAAMVFVSWTVGRYHRAGFLGSLVICLVTSPLFGYLIISASGQKNPKGCSWCGNKYNEAEYCGLCGKNDAGDTRPGFVAKHGKN
jgi:hypothetical protein